MQQFDVKGSLVRRHIEKREEPDKVDFIGAKEHRRTKWLALSLVEACFVNGSVELTNSRSHLSKNFSFIPSRLILLFHGNQNIGESS